MFTPLNFVTLPASAYPEPADRYICDKCGFDLTQHLYVSEHCGPPRDSPHGSGAPIGTERFVCRCGEKYITGKIEWDHLGDVERRTYLCTSLIIGIVLSAVALIPAAVLFAIFKFALGLPEVAVASGVFIATVPFALIQYIVWLGVFASIWRTRFGVSRDPGTRRMRRRAA